MVPSGVIETHNRLFKQKTYGYLDNEPKYVCNFRYLWKLNTKSMLTECKIPFQRVVFPESTADFVSVFKVRHVTYGIVVAAFHTPFST